MHEEILQGFFEKPPVIFIGISSRVSQEISYKFLHGNFSWISSGFIFGNSFKDCLRNSYIHSFRNLLGIELEILLKFHVLIFLMEWSRKYLYKFLEKFFLEFPREFL